VDRKLKGSDIFFTESSRTISKANAVVLYNLTPDSVCRIRNLEICDNRCSGRELALTLLGGANMVYAGAVQMVASMTFILFAFLYL